MAARLGDLIGWRVVHGAPPGFCDQLDWICFLEQSVNPPIALEAALLLATPPVGFEPTTGCLEGRHSHTAPQGFWGIVSALHARLHAPISQKCPSSRSGVDPSAIFEAARSLANDGTGFFRCPF